MPCVQLFCCISPAWLHLTSDGQFIILPSEIFSQNFTNHGWPERFSHQVRLAPAVFFLHQGCLSFSLKHLLSLVLTLLPKVLTYLLMNTSRAERIRGGDNNHWEGSLRLPALAASGLAGHCSIIDVQYRLDLHVDPNWSPPAQRSRREETIVLLCSSRRPKAPY